MAAGLIVARESCRVDWGPRVLGLAVLVTVVAVAFSLGLGDGAPTVTWVVLGVFGGVSLLASISNFGDRFEVDDEGIRYENALTGLVGWPRRRHVSWDRVVQASEYEGRTWFLTVEGQRRWVLDRLDVHERLRYVFQEKGVPIRVAERPRPWRRGLREPR